MTAIARRRTDILVPGSGGARLRVLMRAKAGIPRDTAGLAAAARGLDAPEDRLAAAGLSATVTTRGAEGRIALT